LATVHPVTRVPTVVLCAMLHRIYARFLPGVKTFFSPTTQQDSQNVQRLIELLNDSPVSKDLPPGLLQAISPEQVVSADPVHISRLVESMVIVAEGLASRYEAEMEEAAGVVDRVVDDLWGARDAAVLAAEAKREAEKVLNDLQQAAAALSQQQSAPKKKSKVKHTDPRLRQCEVRVSNLARDERSLCVRRQRFDEELTRRHLALIRRAESSAYLLKQQHQRALWQQQKRWAWELTASAREVIRREEDRCKQALDAAEVRLNNELELAQDRCKQRLSQLDTSMRRTCSTGDSLRALAGGKRRSHRQESRRRIA